MAARCQPVREGRRRWRLCVPAGGGDGRCVRDAVRHVRRRTGGRRVLLRVDADGTGARWALGLAGRLNREWADPEAVLASVPALRIAGFGPLDFVDDAGGPVARAVAAGGPYHARYWPGSRAVLRVVTRPARGGRAATAARPRRAPPPRRRR